MGRVTFVYDPRELKGCTIEWSGELLDLLKREYPEGFNTGETVTYLDMKSGCELKDDALYNYGPIGDRHVSVCLSPAGLDPFTQALIVAAVIVSSIGLTFLLAPKLPGRGANEDAGSVYSVGAQANEAKLGGVVPKVTGRFTRTPEYASQSYRYFENNNETRIFQLCLGLGDVDVEKIYIGNTNISELPQGVARWKVYKPSDHQSTFGIIGDDFGAYEDVYTSGDVSQQELDAGEVISFEVEVISQTRLDAISGAVPEGVVVGGFIDMLVRQPSFGVITRERVRITDISGSLITIEAQTSVSVGRIVTVQAVSAGASIIGPFPAMPPKRIAEAIEIDVEFPGGLYSRDDEGNYRVRTVNIQVTCQRIDESNQPIADPVVVTLSFSSKENTPQRYTRAIPGLTPGRWRVSLRRVDDEDDDNASDRCNWTGLRSYLIPDPNLGPVYGDMTILMLELKGAQGYSEGSKSQIRVTCLGHTPSVDPNVTNQPGDANLADVIADIYTNQGHGGRRPLSEIEQSSFLAFRQDVAGLSGFNGVFDSRTTIEQAMDAVATLGRAKVLPTGQGIRIAMDRPQPRRKSIVTPDNIIAGSLKAEWTLINPGQEDGIEVQIKAPDTGEDIFKRWPVSSLNPQKRRVLGLADVDEAFEMAEYLWRQKTERNAQITFRTERDARNWSMFDRVGVVFPRFNWGEAAEVIAADGRNLILSRQVPEGSIVLQFLDEKGQATDPVIGIGDGADGVMLNDDPPFAFALDGKSALTIVVYGKTLDHVRDVTILSVKPNRNTADVMAVNYIPDL